MKNIEKAYAITDAKISYVSLVDKAANKKTFLITKAEDGAAEFQSFGRILKSDSETHQVVGIVYEPMVEDAHGNFMTAEEIEKAAHWFMRNQGSVDIQHSFEKAEGVEVVESSIALCDMEIEDQLIKKGTWLMAMEVSNEDTWEAIEKGELTGFSMGGIGKYDTEDVNIEGNEIEKNEDALTLFQKLAKALGYDAVKKGAVKDRYNSDIKSDSFWSAWYALRETLETYHWDEEKQSYIWGFEEDPSKVREALQDFSEIAESILINDSGIVKALEGREAPVEKAGKQISSKNLETLSGIATSLSDFVASFKDTTEDESAGDDSEDGDVAKSDDNSIKGGKDMTKTEVETLVSEQIQKSLEPITKQLEEIVKGETPAQEPAAEPAAEPVAEASAQDVSQIVADEVEKALEPITKQLEVIRKTRALPSNLNDVKDETVEKAEPHYLHGII